METHFDIIIVGGGLAGSALGTSLASNGVRTLILEREARFRDRVRGEQMASWGVAEADRLGVLDVLRRTCGHDHPYFNFSLGGISFGNRDLRATTPQAEPGMTFFHPDMQEALLAAAMDAGAQVRRGVTVRGVRTNGLAQITIEENGRTEELHTRMAVGADGRNSVVRRAAGFEPRHDPPFLVIGGVLVDGIDIDDSAAHVHVNPAVSQSAAVFPQGGGRARAYAIYPEDAGFRLQGERDIPRFVDEVANAGFPRDLFTNVRFAGPLASFGASDVWTDHPYRNGVALIGDAAAANNPAWGQGLSLGLMDARVLSEALLGTKDWNEAGRAYAREHDRYYGVMHDVTEAMTEMFLGQGPEANARRARALPRIAEDPTRAPDHIMSGPDLPWSDAHRERFFGFD